MSGRLPEHIDEIESFYKENLGDFESFPSPDLWSKIDASLSQAVDSKVGAAQKSIWKSKWFLGGIGVVALTAIVIAGFYTKTVSVHSAEIDSENRPLLDSDVKKLPILQEEKKSETLHAPSKVSNEVESKDNLKIVDPKLDDEKDSKATLPISIKKNDSTTIPHRIEETVARPEEELKPVAEEEPEPSKKNMIERLKEKNKGKNDLFLKKDK